MIITFSVPGLSVSRPDKVTRYGQYTHYPLGSWEFRGTSAEFLNPPPPLLDSVTEADVQFIKLEETGFGYRNAPESLAEIRELERLRAACQTSFENLVFMRLLSPEPGVVGTWTMQIRDLCKDSILLIKCDESELQWCLRGCLGKALKNFAYRPFVSNLRGETGKTLKFSQFVSFVLANRTKPLILY